MSALPAIERHRFSIGPLSWAIDLPDFERWLEQADVKAELVYAGGPALPQAMPVVIAVREAVAAGDVRSHQRKVDGRWEYFVVRRRPDVAPRPGRSARDAIAPDSLKGQMLSRLSIAAANARPCPTNAELAMALGLKDAEAARYVFNQLHSMGRISVAARGPRMRRVVTIVASGQSTAEGGL